MRRMAEVRKNQANTSVFGDVSSKTCKKRLQIVVSRLSHIKEGLIFWKKYRNIKQTGNQVACRTLFTVNRS